MQRKLPKFARGRTVQQTLPHVYAQKSIFAVTLAFLVIALLMLLTGVAVIAYSDNVLEVSVRYDDVNKYSYAVDKLPDGGGEATTRPHRFAFNGSEYATGVRTRVTFVLPRSVMAPVYMQYRVTGMYQNYRTFGASFDSAQAMHYSAAGTMQKLCAPYRYPGEVRGARSKAGYYSPCGALPWAMFNDSIALYRSEGATATLICDGAAFTVHGEAMRRTETDGDNAAATMTPMCHKRGIAFASDMRRRFLPAEEDGAGSATGPVWRRGGDAAASDPYLRGGYYDEEPGHVIPATDDEDFAVWANIAYIADFRKLYRVIDVPLPAGEYVVDIVEQYPVHDFGGRKYVELVTRSWMGGRNYVLGILLTVVGAAAVVTVIALHILRTVALAPLIVGE